MAEETEEIPQWAKDRACELANAVSGFREWTQRQVGKVGYPTLTAFARYIAKHEQPPVDPDLVKAREICALVAEKYCWQSTSKHFRKGAEDNAPEVQFALAALKAARGKG